MECSLAWGVLGERPSPPSFIACIACAIGTILTAWPSEAHFSGWLPVLATFGAASLFSVNYAALRHIASRTSAFAAVSVTNFFLVLAVLLFRPQTSMTEFSIAPLAFSAISAGMLATSTHFFMMGAKSTPFWLSTSVRGLAPIVVLILSLPVVKVDMSSWNVIGALITMSSVIFVGLSEKMRNQDARNGNPPTE